MSESSCKLTDGDLARERIIAAERHLRVAVQLAGGHRRIDLQSELRAVAVQLALETA